MRLRKVYGVVFRKELRELVRDRRSLFWLFAPPIILPSIGICAALFIGSQVARLAEEGFPITIENAQAAPDLVAKLQASEVVLVVDEAEAGQTAMVVVEIPPDFQTTLEAGGTATLQLTTRNSSIISFFATGAVRGVIDAYSREVVDERLATQGLSREWLAPITIGERRVSTTSSVTGENEEGGSNILATIFLPLAVTSWLLGGGMGLVLDATVGEKERQTIENLLVTPASRIGLVLGKMSVIFIASMAVMSLWLAEGLALNALGTTLPALSRNDNLATPDVLNLLLESGADILPLIGALLLLLIPFTVMLNALVMSWCAYAANYREANLFMALFQLGLPATVLLTVFSLPATLPASTYSIPLLGTIVAIRDLFSQALSPTGLGVNILSTSLYALGAVWLAAWVFGREWSLTRGLQ
jgi:sodium transport system permease protein